MVVGFAPSSCVKRNPRGPNRGRQRRASAAKRSPLDAGLGSGAETLPYGARASALVKADQDDDSVRLREVEQSVRETGKKDEANTPVSDGARKRLFRDEPDGEVERRDEPNSEAFLLRLVPRVRAKELRQEGRDERLGLGS